MIVKYAIPENNKIESYEKMTKDLFLQELEKHGYRKAFDFSRAKIEVYKSKHDVVPHYEASVRLHEDLFYIPLGVKFKRSFELSFVEYEGQLKIKIRDREDYFYLTPQGPYEESVAKINSFENKGPYPGTGYFRDELNQVDKSLRQHKPFIERKLHLQILLDKLPSYGYIYQLSDYEVRLHLSLDNSPVIYPGVKVTYNLETGDITDVVMVPPPSLE